jgi:hypothetical protein
MNQGCTGGHDYLLRMLRVLHAAGAQIVAAAPQRPFEGPVSICSTGIFATRSP